MPPGAKPLAFRGEQIQDCHYLRPSLVRPNDRGDRCPIRGGVWREELLLVVILQGLALLGRRPTMEDLNGPLRPHDGNLR